MTHIQHHQDRDLHDEKGEHISTVPIPSDRPLSGEAVSNWERRIKYHLFCHEQGE